jgi:hypothetical protein
MLSLTKMNAAGLLPKNCNAIKDFCRPTPTPIPLFVPPSTPAEILCKKKGGKHLKPNTKPVLPPPIPYY